MKQQALIKKLEKNKILNFLAFAVLFVCTERTLRTLFIFDCTYRMQTLHTIAFLGCSWLIYILAAIKIKSFYNETTIIPILYFAVYLCYLMATLVNHGDYSKWIDIVLYSLPPMFLVTLMKKEKKLYIRIATIIFAVVAALNILFKIFPVLFSVISDWKEQYFMGYHTFVGWALTFGVFFALLDMKLSNSKIIGIVYLVLYFINFGIVNAGGAKVGALIVLVWVLLPPIRKLFKKCDFLVFISIVIALFAVLMWGLEPFTNFTPIKTLIVDVLHRDVTLSGRLYVWKGALEYTMQKPILGHGIQESSQIFFESSHWNNGMVHAHNAFLQTWYEGGIVTLIASICMLIIGTRKLKNDDVSGITKLILFTFLIMMQNDLDVYYTWYSVAMIMHIGLTCVNTNDG